MSTAELLMVVAMVVSVDGGTATLDQGSEAGLEKGDQGLVFYELEVNGESRRIEVGLVEIAGTEPRAAKVNSPSGAPLRPGYQVEFQIPRPKSVAPEAAPAVAVVGEGLVPSREVAPPETKVVEEGLALSQGIPSDVGEGLVPSPPAPSQDPPPPGVVDPLRDLIHIAAGHYAIGLDLGDAEFFNQTPRHKVLLTEFSIDRYAAREGLSFSDAQAHCQNLGMRLPTEQEWEVAAQQTGFIIQPGLLEWTASWYQAFPGNQRTEDAFGEKFRVLRGASQDNPVDPHARRFMEPSQRNSSVGFRCALDKN